MGSAHKSDGVLPAPSSRGLGTVGSFSMDDGYGSENVTFTMNKGFSNFIAFIPIC